MIKNNKLVRIIFILLGIVSCMGISFLYALYKNAFIVKPFLMSHIWWYIVYTFVITLLACIIVMIGVKAVCSDEHIFSKGKTYIIVMLLFGALYTMTMVPLSVPDEPTHYNNALVVSNKIISFFGVDGTPSQLEMSLKNFGDGSYYYEFWNGIEEADNSFGLTGIWKSEQMPLYPYFLSGTVIALLKFIGAPYQVFVVVGRMINLLLFSFIMLLCVKLCPKFKTIIFSYSLLPAVVWIETSFSYDCLNLAMSSLFICYCLRCRDEQRVTIKEIFKLILLLLVFAPIKYIYAIMAMFVLIIPLSHFQIKNKKRIALISGGTLVVMVLLLAKLRGSEIVYLLGSGADGRFAGTSDTTYTLAYVLSHPINVAFAFFKTIIEKSEFYFLRGLCGENYTNYVPNLLLIILAIIVVRILIGGIDGDISKRDRIVSWMTFVVMTLVILTSFLFLYSVIPSQEGMIGIVDGVQGRYFLPLFLIIPMMISIKKYRLDESKEKYYLFGLLVTNIVITLFKYSGALLN